MIYDWPVISRRDFVLQPGPSGNPAEGYNSEDEYSHLGVDLTEEEWVEKDRRFERALKKKGEVLGTTLTVVSPCPPGVHFDSPF